jgi:hypothetical protein
MNSIRGAESSRGRQILPSTCHPSATAHHAASRSGSAASIVTPCTAMLDMATRSSLGPRRYPRSMGRVLDVITPEPAEFNAAQHVAEYRAEKNAVNIDGLPGFG